MKGKVLVIDDEMLIRSSVNQYLTKEGYDVVTAESGEEGLETCKAELPDIVILDLHMPGLTGLETLETLRKLHKDIVVIIITAHGDIETAVNAIKMGAYDFMEKPFELNLLSIPIEKALETVNLKREVSYLREEKHHIYNFDKIVGVSPVIKDIFVITKKIAESDGTTILIQGESGTGKTLIARAMHYHSARADKPFVEVTCTALPETLVESELFGYEKGAFTDAKSSKKGLFEIADGGTMYLDEIGDMQTSTQAKFLKVIEEKTFKRIGSLKETTVEIRIIATTNKDLKEEVRKGNFREDLYYRLNVIPIFIPPLRERREDIIPLAKHFLKSLQVECRKNISGISKEAEKLFLSYSWPGNIRELRNVIERVFILEKDGLILPEHLPLEVTRYRDDNDTLKAHDEFSFSLPEKGISIEDVEKNFIKQALELTGKNQTKAAQLLSISRDALRYRMQKFRIT